MGFALFSTAQFAVAARDALQEMIFDAETKSVLHTEMAKKNLFVKRGFRVPETFFVRLEENQQIAVLRHQSQQNENINLRSSSTSLHDRLNPPRPDPPHPHEAKSQLCACEAPSQGIVADSNAYDQSKRLRTGGDYTHTGYTTPSPFHPPPAPVWGPHGYMAPAPPPYDPYGGYPVPPVPMPAPAPVPVPAPSSYVPVQNTKDNPPCNTLFIGNLGENINEEELRGLFSAQPGFKQMKILRQERHTVCFIEFEDMNSATNVHHNFQGAVIPSSGSVGMRIQYPFSTFLVDVLLFFLVFYHLIVSTYSKNPFGKRKDAGHPIASPGANGAPPAMTYQ
ncbi:hypothetical protein JRO89_XS09G0069500 [Xanthoceras sorbifolium]|uniref:RRM domain-containing protein n=1 Tax=Xanthoceras sorbifolium TaxID=99658 RepID=A0ABQ8HKS7_9ROSI|nr:hypothetical protein JRO89_XS09G0069500 [Xanthoceras sorbifolium]